VIKRRRLKGLKELYATGRSRHVAPALTARVLRRLDALNVATSPQQMNIPGFDFHALHGSPRRYTVHVNGPWCVTFGWDGTDAVDVDLEQYH
jgi:proteic killer suppression protein